MKHLFLFAILSVGFFPQISFGFSETEIDSLESSGKKSFSSSLWRTQIDFALQRNLEVSSRFSDLLDINKDTSLLDPSNIYYMLKLNLNYSLREIAKNFNFLKNGEIFLISSFNSPFSGYNNNLSNYNWMDYIQYGLGDITGGLTVPTYKAENFLSYFSAGWIAFPLSRFSREAGLSSTIDGTVSLLYFIHKRKDWSLAFSSSHNLAYSRYKKEAADSKGNYYNIPWDSSHGGGFIYRQNRSKKWPSNIRVSTVYYLGIDTKSTRNHDLTLNSSLSWKIRNQFYLNFTVKWKDRIYVSNPSNPDVGKKEPIRFDLTRTFFIFGGSYSF